MWRGVLVASVILGSGVASGVAQAQAPGDIQIRVTTPGCSNMGMVRELHGKFVVFVEVQVPDWHALVNNTTLIVNLLNRARDTGLTACRSNPQLRAASVTIRATNSQPLNPLSAWWADGQWHVTDNFLPRLQQQEAAIAADRARREAEQRRLVDEAAAAEKALAERRQAAVADCGKEPKFSGGPWLSSTYSVGATDEARRARFFCVKSIEYVGAAVNPMGGKAARAKFIGYSQPDFQRREEIRDFPY